MPVVKEDCDWVVGRYRSYLLHNDKSAAKAWILTASSLFPDNFEVQVRACLVYWCAFIGISPRSSLLFLQYESFSLHLLCNELKEAAKVLNEL